MAEIQVRNVPQTLPAGFCPATEQERFNMYIQYLLSTLSITATVLNVGSSTPSANDQNRPWLRLNPVNGSFDRIYNFVDGKWRSPHPDFVGKVVMWEGNIGNIATLDGGAAGAVTVDSGPFWEEVTAAIGKFPVHPDPTPTNLATAIAVTGTGGEEKHTNLLTEIPYHDHIGFGQLTTASGDTNGASTTAANTAKLQQFETSSTGGDPANSNATVAHNNMPPYYGIYLIRRTARLYYTV